MDEFYTMKGYQIKEDSVLTPAMEDYLEMICRLMPGSDGLKAGELSRMLHVKPSSVTKMLQQLKNQGYINFEKYGHITLTDKGTSEGEYLLYRHDVIRRFLCKLNKCDDALEEAEKIEHFLSRKTVENLCGICGLLE